MDKLGGEIQICRIDLHACHKLFYAYKLAANVMICLSGMTIFHKKNVSHQVGM